MKFRQERPSTKIPLTLPPFLRIGDPGKWIAHSSPVPMPDDARQRREKARGRLLGTVTDGRAFTTLTVFATGFILKHGLGVFITVSTQNREQPMDLLPKVNALVPIIASRRP